MVVPLSTIRHVFETLFKVRSEFSGGALWDFKVEDCWWQLLFHMASQWSAVV